MKFFEKWKVIEACCRLENQIYEDKLNYGINGLEWLVLQTEPDELMRESLWSYTRYVMDKHNYEFEKLIKDAFRMDNLKFHEKYKLNWWVTISEGLSYLSLLRKKNYDIYFDFIISLGEFKGGELVGSQ
jgi:hypothetical protein